MELHERQNEGRNEEQKANIEQMTNVVRLKRLKYRYNTMTTGARGKIDTM